MANSTTPDYSMMGHGAPAASSGKQIKSVGMGKTMSGGGFGKGKKNTSIGKSKGAGMGKSMGKTRC